MGLLDRFLGSDQYLRQPDFVSAPSIDINFSGTRLRFKDPAHTALFPITDWPGDKNIYDLEGYERLNDGRYLKRFYVKGWNLTGRLNHKHGGVIASAALEMHIDKDDGYSNFDKNCFESSIFEYCHAVWGWQNKADKPGELGQGPYIFPVKSSELRYSEINGVSWCGIEVYITGQVPMILYFTPISNQHTLILIMRIDLYKGLDFFSPATNIKEASYQVIDNFLKYFYIELSDDAKAQQASTNHNLKL